MTYAPGNLIHARGRDWVVQPDSTDDYLVLRPLGGRAEEATGLYLPLEADGVRPAAFGLPTSADLGDARSASLLRDAARLNARAISGPFRSFGRINVTPRPYQLVPLLMALRLDPVRLLVADDVGVGKTIEAALIARELLDRGEIRRLVVVCPPHLADQWQSELRDRFHIDAELVLPSSARRLERDLRIDESLFDRHPFTIVSLDYIKSERRRHDFLRSAPELVLVDEAHTCADPGRVGSSQHQRHQLLRDLAREHTRHLLLVTATPHSGNEDAFRSLLTLLKPEYAHLPDDLSGPENETRRRELARHFVQRKRGDIRRYLDADTPFPERDDQDLAYALTPAYHALFDKVLRFARETLQDASGGHRQRVRWWAMLGLLRALASSPAAAASTLRNRAAPADTTSLEDADDLGRRLVLDTTVDDTTDALDVPPGAQESDDEGNNHRRRLLAYAREAEALTPADDAKLQQLIELVRQLLADGYAPIVFCRFIPTAEYVAEHLRAVLRNVDAAAVTGTLPHEERHARVEALASSERRVLVATDCLSEGINLQASFDAVVHYDLAWNPTRHEQREGRVDRFGQARERVRITTIYGRDNQIDGIVLDVLIQKHRRIRTSLGISVPVPARSEQVIEAIFEGLLLRGLDRRPAEQQALFDDLDRYIKPAASDLQRLWDAAADRERRSRTMFAQEGIRVDDVAREQHAIQYALGGPDVVQRFVERAVTSVGGTLTPRPRDTLDIDLTTAPAPLTDTLEHPTFRASFTHATPGTAHLTRTHPIVAALATFVLDSALDPHANAPAARAGVMRTHAVHERTTLLLARYRHHLTTRRGDTSWDTLAEDTLPLAFTGPPDDATWLDPDAARALLDAAPAGNVDPGQARHHLERQLAELEHVRAHLDAIADERASALLEAHRRVRAAAQATGLRYTVTPLPPADILGVYLYLPA